MGVNAIEKGVYLLNMIQRLEEEWGQSRSHPLFKPGQFSTNIAQGVFPGTGDVESALDVEAVHGMAPAARVTYVVGNGKITGDRLLDALDTVVT